MQAVREVFQTRSRNYSVRIPDWAVGRKMELIMLPTGEDQVETRDGEVSLIDHLLAHPLKLSSFAPLARESVHER